MLMETMRMELAFDLSRRQQRSKNAVTRDRNPVDTADRALPVSDEETDASADGSPDTCPDHGMDAAG